MVDALIEEIGLLKVDAKKVVNELLTEVGDALVRGEPVKVASFGSFQIRHWRGHIGRNIRTGEEHPIPPRRAVVFKASQALNKRVMLGRP